jgi:predicted dehydrogenase
MKRRDFVKTALTAAAGGLSTYGHAEGPSSASPRLRIGFLGAVHSHAAEKLKVVRASGDWELVGVCEADAAARRQCQAQSIALLAQDELLARCQAVAVESAVEDHARHARIALLAGKHLHVEKPPADTLEALRELVALARGNRLVMQMGYMWRYHPGINAVLEAARKGWLGEVYLVRGTMNNQLEPARRPQWGRFRGGVLFELGSHLIDAMVRLMGRPTAIHSVLRTHGDSKDNFADNTVAVFEFPRAIGIVSSATLQPNSNQYRSFEVLGTGGTAVVRPIEPPALTIDLTKPAGPYRAGTNQVKLPPYGRYIADFAALARAVRDNRPLDVTPDEDLLVQEALIRASGM